MIRKALIVTVITVVTGTPAFADGASREEGAGVGLGAVVGAVAGGPVGAIIGAAAGARIGDSLHRRGETIDELSAEVAGVRGRNAALESSIVALKGELASTSAELGQARAQLRPDLLALLQAGIEMDLLFRTDEDVLVQETGARLQQLAGSLAANPDVRILLDGFADERGDAAYNQALSARRAEHVRSLLVANGVPAARITVVAHGESPAADDGPDSLAFERRVSLTLYTGDAPAMTAALDAGDTMTPATH